LERAKFSEAAKNLKDMVQLTGVQGVTDYKLCLLRRMWILSDLVSSQQGAPQTYQSVYEISRNVCCSLVGRIIHDHFTATHSNTMCLFSCYVFSGSVAT